MSSKKPSNYYYVKDLSDMLGVGKWTIYDWIKKGDIPAPADLPGRKRWPKVTFDAWLKERGGAPN